MSCALNNNNSNNNKYYCAPYLSLATDACPSPATMANMELKLLLLPHSEAILTRCLATATRRVRLASDRTAVAAHINSRLTRSLKADREVVPIGDLWEGEDLKNELVPWDGLC